VSIRTAAKWSADAGTPATPGRVMQPVSPLNHVDKAPHQTLISPSTTETTSVVCQSKALGRRD
jgi:hypothetical protein